jgi:hypothetical protein
MCSLIIGPPSQHGYRVRALRSDKGELQGYAPLPFRLKATLVKFISIFADTDVIDVNRKYFSESYGAQTVSRLVVPENSSIEHSVSSK